MDQEALLRSRRNVLCSITCRLFDQRLEVKTSFPRRAGTVHGISCCIVVAMGMRPDAPAGRASSVGLTLCSSCRLSFRSGSAFTRFSTLPDE
jgi:hypothetical protein